MKYSAFGTTLEMGQGDEAPETFDEIANVRNISGPGISLDTEDATTHDSTNAWEEVVPTVLRTGDLTLEIVYDPSDDTHDEASDLGLLAKIANKTLTNFKITWPDAVEWSFAAYVRSFEPGAPHDGSLTASVGLKISGAPTLA